jgi:hypothetical protein
MLLGDRPSIPEYCQNKHFFLKISLRRVPICSPYRYNR